MLASMEVRRHSIGAVPSRFSMSKNAHTSCTVTFRDSTTGKTGPSAEAVLSSSLAVTYNEIGKWEGKTANMLFLLASFCVTHPYICSLLYPILTVCIAHNTNLKVHRKYFSRNIKSAFKSIFVKICWNSLCFPTYIYWSVTNSSNIVAYMMLWSQKRNQRISFLDQTTGSLCWLLLVLTFLNPLLGWDRMYGPQVLPTGSRLVCWLWVRNLWHIHRQYTTMLSLRHNT